MRVCALHLLDLCFLSNAHPHNLQFRLYLLSIYCHVSTAICLQLPTCYSVAHNLTFSLAKHCPDCRLSVSRFVVLPSVKSFCFLLPFIAFQHCTQRRLSFVALSTAVLCYLLPLERHLLCHIFVLFCLAVLPVGCSAGLPFHFISLGDCELFSFYFISFSLRKYFHLHCLRILRNPFSILLLLLLLAIIFQIFI